MEKVFIALEEIRKASGPRRKYLALHIGVAASKPFFKVSWHNRSLLSDCFYQRLDMLIKSAEYVNLVKGSYPKLNLVNIVAFLS